jgi:hypothetical protein
MISCFLNKEIFKISKKFQKVSRLFYFLYIENNFKLFNKGQTFDFINWDNLYLTGNFITACCINSPLINLVKKYMIDEVDYELYLEEYYENRVYEFIYDNNENSNKNFLNKVNELMTELEDKFKIQKIKMNYTIQINLSNEFI